MDSFENVAPIHWVTCEVIKECGYHDVHEIGEIISVDRNHLDDMLNMGWIRIIGSDC